MKNTYGIIDNTSILREDKNIEYLDVYCQKIDKCERANIDNFGYSNVCYIYSWIPNNYVS